MSTAFYLNVNHCNHCDRKSAIHLFNISSNGLFIIEGYNEEHRNYEVQDLLDARISRFYGSTQYQKYRELHNIKDMFRLIKKLIELYPNSYIVDENSNAPISVEEIKKLLKKSKAENAAEYFRKYGEFRNTQKVSNYLVFHLAIHQFQHFHEHPLD